MDRAKAFNPPLVESAARGHIETGLWTPESVHSLPRGAPGPATTRHPAGMPYVYILRCADNSYYVGSARQLENRVDQHNSGYGAEYTKRRLPVELVFAAEFDNVGDAYALEKQIQGWSRAKREALIEGRFGDLRGLSRKKFPKKMRDDGT